MSYPPAGALSALQQGMALSTIQPCALQNSLPLRVMSHRIYNIFKPRRNSSSLSHLRTKKTTALNPIPENAYERNNILFSSEKAITLPCSV